MLCSQSICPQRTTPTDCGDLLNFPLVHVLFISNASMFARFFRVRVNEMLFKPALYMNSAYGLIFLPFTVHCTSSNIISSLHVCMCWSPVLWFVTVCVCVCVRVCVCLLICIRSSVCFGQNEWMKQSSYGVHWVEAAVCDAVLRRV